MRATIQVFALCMLMSSVSLANNHNEVKDWVTNVLVSSLTACYTGTNEDNSTMRHYFTTTAWRALNSFLGSQIETMRKQKLMFHPQAKSAPILLKTGYYSGIHYWRIKQSIALSKDKSIDFEVTVLETEPLYNSRFVIQRINMTIVNGS